MVVVRGRWGYGWKTSDRVHSVHPGDGLGACRQQGFSLMVEMLDSWW